MNQERSSKFVPGLPDDEPSNENVPTAPDSTINIFEGVAECTMTDSDNLKSVKVKAKNLAEENVQKQIADYIRAFLKDRYLSLPEAETLSIANEISNITDVKYNTRDSDDDIIIRATVTAKLDNKDIMNYIISFFKERAELKSQNEALRKENEALKQENENFKCQIEELKRQLANNQQINNLARSERLALALEKFDVACSLDSKDDYANAIKLYSEAIELNPNAPKFYHYRGCCYKRCGNRTKAQDDLAKAKKLGW